jgi:predicted PurR-regulated permease PerM
LAVGPRERLLTDSTARDDAPLADKQNFFEGGSGDRAAFVPFVGIIRSGTGRPTSCFLRAWAVPVESSFDDPHARAQRVRDRYAPAEPRALGALAILATVALVAVLLPVGLGVLLGALLAFTAQGAYTKLVRRTHKPGLVALALTLVTTIVVTGTFALLAYLLVLQGVQVVAALPQSFAPGGTAAALIERITAPFAHFGLRPSDIATKLGGASGAIASSLAGWAARIVGTVLDSALAVLFMAITMYFVLRHWHELAKRAEFLLPVNPGHTRRLMRELRRQGRQVVVGNFGTAVIQGTVAGIGFAVARVPQAMFLGALTAVVSLLPAVGTLIVWVPAGLILLAGGHTAAGIFDLAWGTIVVVGVCDYVVRPRLVGHGETTSTWLTFVALFGGLKVFGIAGFLLGPLVVSFSVAVLKLYARTRRFRLGV